MVKVTMISLRTRIDNLERLKTMGVISMEGDFKLAAYKMLLERLENEEAESLEFKNHMERMDLEDGE